MRRILVIVLLVAIALMGLGYCNATRTPVMRQANVALPDWPAGQRPIRVALISDTHVVGPDMPPDRLGNVVAQVNAAKPDLILLAGDFTSERSIATRHYSAAQAVAPLGGLRAPLGVIAVLGNHDHWTGQAQVVAALRAASIDVLVNQAVTRGPVTIAGIDDAFTGNADIASTMAAAGAFQRPLVVLTHDPDISPDLPASAHLVLAGHTHCGQIVLPLIGAVSHMSRYGDRYRCGVVREGARTTIVGAGIGASILPIRFGARPDWWMVTLGGQPRR